MHGTNRESVAHRRLVSLPRVDPVDDFDPDSVDLGGPLPVVYPVAVSRDDFRRQPGMERFSRGASRA